MATKNLLPMGDSEGGIGTPDFNWGEGFFVDAQCTGAFVFPLTTTADRPSNAKIGATFFDTNLDALIIWGGSEWVELI